MKRKVVETGIYLSERTYDWVYEVCWYDSDGKQRWKAVGKDLEIARAERKKRSDLGRGGASKYRRLRRDLFDVSRIADNHEVPTKDMIINAMKATSGSNPRKAWLTLAGLALAQARRYERVEVTRKAAP